MKIKHVLATAGAALAMAGMTATTAHADHDLTGGDYTAAAEADFSTTVGGAYTISCTAPTFSGNTENVPGDPSSTLMAPTFTDCNFYGLPAVASTPDPWKLTVGGYAFGGLYEAALANAGDTLLELDIPLMNCRITYEVPDGTYGYVNRSAAGAVLQPVGMGSIAYEASESCPFASGNDGTFNTNGNVVLSGVDIAAL